MNLSLRILFFLIIVFSSCRTIKNAYLESKNEKNYFSVNTEVKITYGSNGIPRIYAKVNNKKGLFLLDTGSPVLAIFDYDFIKDFPLNNKNYYSSNRIKTPDEQRLLYNTFIIDTLTSEMFKSFKKTSIVLQNYTYPPCDFNKEIGIIGNDLFLSSEYPIYFDFDHNSLKVINKEYDIKEFIKLKSKFKDIGSKVLIKIKLNNEEKWVTLDTGYNGFIHLNEFEHNEKVEYKTYVLFADQKPIMANATFYTNVLVEIADLPSFKGQVESYNNVSSNVIGMKFINLFNWIIDYQEKVIYVKPVKNINEKIKKINNKGKYKYRAKVISNKLLIVVQPIGLDIFQLGDEIIEVKDEKINEDNICKFKDFLNSDVDWNYLNIKIKNKGNDNSGTPQKSRN